MFSVVLWSYIALLLAGGVIGYVKAKSTVSLVSSLIFALLLALCAAGTISSHRIAEILIGVLLVLFGVRFARKKKFMPAGLMAIISALALVLILIA